MVLVITQQTFDEAVQENINDLGLSPEDAVIEAVTQFKAQVSNFFFVSLIKCQFYNRELT